MNPFDEVTIDPASQAYLDLTGLDRWFPWTVTRTGWTDVGTPTVTGRFHVAGKVCQWQVNVVPSTSIATTAGTSYIVLPRTARGLAGIVTMFNATTKVAVGVGGIDVTNNRAYLPTQGASGDTFTIAGYHEI